jgi:L-alanine-DL-glutamate epimerase-like enolase superfamily enzyme
VKIESVRVYEFDHKLVEPFVISFATWHHAENLLVLIDTDEGITGYGEASPFKAITDDTRDDALTFLKGAVPLLTGQDPTEIESIHELLEDASKKTAVESQTSKAALDFACHDIWGQTEGKPVYQLLGRDSPRVVPTTITIGIKSLEETAKDARKLMHEYGKDGLRRIKLKVSGDADMDIRRVSAVADVYPGELTLDANQGYKDPTAAIGMLQRVFEHVGPRVILIEEPCPRKQLDMLKRVKENSEIPVYADESMATLEDMELIVAEEAADGVNIKLPKAGGIFWGRKIADLAERSGISVMVGPMLDGAIAIAAGAHFAAATDVATNADLDTDYYFGTSIAKRVPFRNGARVPTAAPGLGIELENWVRTVLDGEVELRRRICPPTAVPPVRSSATAAAGRDIPSARRPRPRRRPRSGLRC